jgi:hypothetical protein
MSDHVPEPIKVTATTPSLPVEQSPPATQAPPKGTAKPSDAVAAPESPTPAEPAAVAEPVVDPTEAEATSGPPPSPPESEKERSDAAEKTRKEKFVDAALSGLDPEQAAEIKKRWRVNEIKRAAEEYELANPPELGLAAHTIPAESVKPVSWVVPDFIAIGGMTNVIGDPGACKSWVVIDVVAHVTTERALGDRGPTLQGDVLMILSEDDPYSVVAPRLQQQGGDSSRVHYHRLGAEASCLQTLDLLTHRRLLSKRLDKLPNVRLVVADSLDMFLGVKDPSRIRVGLSRLLQFFEARGIAFIAVSPLRKSENKSASDLLAELPFSSLSTGVWHVQPDYRYANRRRVVALKQKLANASDMDFEIDPNGKLLWLPTRNDRSTGRGDSKLLRAARCITAELDTGPKSSSYMHEYLAACGFSDSTIDRAKLKLDINTEKVGTTWQWSLAD